MANKNDEKILALKKQIEEKKEKLGKIGRFVAVTNCVLHLDGTNNLNVLNKESLQQLLIKVNTLAMSAKALKLEKVLYSGFTLDEWVTDISGKLDVLSKKDEERNLNALEAKLSKMLSDEKQVELELDAIANLLND